MKMEQCSKTSPYKIQTPKNHPKERIQHIIWQQTYINCRNWTIAQLLENILRILKWNMATMAAREKKTPITFYCRNAVFKESGMYVDNNEKQKPGMQCTQVGNPVIMDPNEIVGIVHLASGEGTDKSKQLGQFRPNKNRDHETVKLTLHPKCQYTKIGQNS